MGARMPSWWFWTRVWGAGLMKRSSCRWRGWMGCRDSIGLPCVNGIGDNWLVCGGADTRVESLCDNGNYIWATRCRCSGWRLWVQLNCGVDATQRSFSRLLVGLFRAQRPCFNDLTPGTQLLARGRPRRVPPALRPAHSAEARGKTVSGHKQTRSIGRRVN
ncbi:hypothetical protein BT67DRAFT_63446 [Trichocladium antarcticum]|uniref:Secreted protein n=1 Tax=Trichocladium antarcticum TaxID=1450529 RepID=A0AAN6ZCL3_9PEZI|nr:hypothetical protein BT67DRAFT_63446 [Trichocladium antarcticum]